MEIEAPVIADEVMQIGFEPRRAKEKPPIEIRVTAMAPVDFFSLSK